MTDMGFDGAMYDGTDGSIDTFERLGDGWMPFAHLPSSTDADLAAQSPVAKRILKEKEAAGSLKKRAKLSADEQWNGMLERLVAFRDRFGQCNVPKRYLDDPQLHHSHEFVRFITMKSLQLQFHKSKENTDLTEEQETL